MLVSFAVVEDDYSFKIPINYLKLTEEIDYQDFDVEINVLGLRNLESFGLMPIKKAFVRFNLRSLLPPEKA
jgi:flagellar assembly factor FliW